MNTMKMAEYRPEDRAENLTYGANNADTRDRLREMILYISALCGEDQHFGVTKLNKILFYADFISFLRYGEPITGVEYMKLPQGPAPLYIMRVREEMENNKELVVRKQNVHTYVQHRLIPLREPRFDMFKARDVALINEIVEMLCDMNARDVSDLSHGRAWQIASEKGLIPYEAVLISDAPLNSDDIAWAQNCLQ